MYHAGTSPLRENRITKKCLLTDFLHFFYAGLFILREFYGILFFVPYNLHGRTAFIMNEEKNIQPVNDVSPKKKKKEQKEPFSLAVSIYDLAEMIAVTSIGIMLLFSFILRLNVVDGISMEQTLYDNQFLAVWELGYEPEAGDIVIIHDQNAAPYDHPIVKRVIATGGQTVDIDFNTWTLTVDGEVIDEPYRYLDPASGTLTVEYSLPITLKENEIFVMGDNRNHSADSRQIEIGPVDERCVVGKAFMRIFPIDEITVFSNPRKD